MQRTEFFRSAFNAALIALLTLTTTLTPTPSTAKSNAHTYARSYGIVYVRQPRKGDNEHIVWPEVFHPARVEPNSDLMLLHPDGSEEVLLDTTNGAVTDPFVSFDAQWVYYSFFPDVRTDSSTISAAICRMPVRIFTAST